MRSIFGIVGIIGLCAVAHAQDLVVKRSNESLPATKVDDKIWLVRLDGEDYFILQRSTVDSLTKKVAIKNAIIERHEKVLAVKDTLLAKYTAFEQKANAHIDTQKKLITTADSLYLGYKSLYKDFKRFVGLSNYALTAGIGLADLPGNAWKPMFSLGGGYRNWQAQYQFGKDYRGIVVGYRLPFGF